MTDQPTINPTAICANPRCGHTRNHHYGWQDYNPGGCAFSPDCPCEEYKMSGHELHMQEMSMGTDISDYIESESAMQQNVDVELETTVKIRFQTPIDLKRLTELMEGLANNANLGEKAVVKNIRVIKGDQPYAATIFEISLSSTPDA